MVATDDIMLSVGPIPEDKPLSDTDFNISEAAKMRPEAKQQWLEFLRSGDYKQVVGALKQLLPVVDGDVTKAATYTDEIGHCCLGVLCEVAVVDGIIPDAVREREQERWVKHDGDCTEYCGDDTTTDDEEWHDGGYETWPEGEAPELSSWGFDGCSDMPSNKIYIWAGLPYHVAKYLAHKNDQGSSFGDIADWIERNL